MKKLILLITLPALLASCKRPEQILPLYNAEVLNYERGKCYCKHGWMIKIGNDTILSTSPILAEKIGFTLDEPVKVSIEIEKTDDFCNYPYCLVTKLQIKNQQHNIN